MFPYLFALMVIIVGVVFKISRFYDSRRSRKNWLCTDGVVYICRVGTKHDSNGEEFYEPRIRCLYKVKGVVYTITLENTDSWNSTQWEWENVSRYYPGGFTLPVYYDPNNPRHAFVKPPETSVT
jgi:hypothetical protein